jgi:GMP synthase (glutamine-hydrolysing)
MRALFVCCGDPPPIVSDSHGSFADWFREGLGADVSMDEVDARTEALHPTMLDGFDAMVISGSPHAAYEPHAWIPPLEDLVREAVHARKLPVLGVCFGHQVVAQALGGRVTPNPRGREIGTAVVRPNEHGRGSAMLRGLSDPFRVQLTHCDTVATPPPGARVLAASDRDECQAFEMGSAWCVQFHPEITADVIRAYLNARRDVITSEGLDVDRLLEDVCDTDVGRTIFSRFVAFARECRR